MIMFLIYYVNQIDVSYFVLLNHMNSLWRSLPPLPHVSGLTSLSSEPEKRKRMVIHADQNQNPLIFYPICKMKFQTCGKKFLENS